MHSSSAVFHFEDIRSTQLLPSMELWGTPFGHGVDPLAEVASEKLVELPPEIEIARPGYRKISLDRRLPIDAGAI